MSEAAAKPPPMTVEEFLSWAEAQPGRYELYNGEVVTMQAEREAHSIVKLSVVLALRRALTGTHSGCRALPDGRTVKIDGNTSFEPDALIDCGPRDPDNLLASKPVLVVEVVSPSTSRIDEGRKFVGYFSVPSIQHYLIVDTRERIVVHHRRQGEAIMSHILNARQAGQGSLRLDPPGISVEIADFFADLDDEG